MFSIHGHEHAVNLLNRALAARHLHHAYLISGPNHIGKTTLAIQIAQAINCENIEPPCQHCQSCLRIHNGLHADVVRIGLTFIDEAQQNIPIDSIRELKRSASLKPYEGRVRVYVIEEAERLSIPAMNALLKTLEEPPPDTILILLTSDASSLPATIVSRCMQLILKPLPISSVEYILQKQYDFGADESRELARLSRGCIGWALKSIENPEPLASLHQKLERIANVCESEIASRFAYSDDLARRFQRDRNEARNELYLWLSWWRDILLINQGHRSEIVHSSWEQTLGKLSGKVTNEELVSWVHTIMKTIEALEHNANPRLALEVMMLDLPIVQATNTTSSKS